MNNRLAKYIIVLVVLVLILVAILYGTKPGMVGDLIWLDQNKNGLQDPDELGIANIPVEVYNFLGSQVAETVSDADGAFSFPNLGVNFYFLVFRPPVDFTLSTMDMGDDDQVDSDPDPLNGETVKFLLLPGSNDLKWDAGMYRIATEITPTKTPTLTPTQKNPTLTPTLTPTFTLTPTSTLSPTPASCGCNSPGVTFTILGGGTGGWSDCGQSTACHSLIGDQTVTSGTSHWIGFHLQDAG